jgi:hypothetical protein
MSRISTKHRMNCLNRLTKGSFLCGVLSFALAHTALATIPLYDNESVLNSPPDPIPTIDASNFLNNSSLTINFTTPTINTPLFETKNTINYTNTNVGTLAANTGFLFDTLTTNQISHQMAGIFYNKGKIFGGSFNDTNLTIVLGLGQVLVSATNIVNPGTIDVGEDGLIQLTGQNLDLTRAVLTIDGTAVETGSGGVFATNRTPGWFPSVDLTTNLAIASPNIFLTLPNPAAYFDIRTNLATGTNVIVRAVFISPNTGANVTNNVFIDPNVNTGNLFGPGAADVEWMGTYVNPVTGLVATNYLVLNDDYVLGSITNVAIVNGIPDNFTIFNSTTPPFLGPPTPSGFPANFAFNAGAVSNTYSYANIQFPSSTVATNSPSQNVTNYLAILPGRIEITANQKLNMNLARISGPNYLSITSTNQYDGSVGAQIFSPYSDINLGVTNGFLTVSNLLEPGTIQWSGSIQAWSARWFMVDTNSGATNDYRVLLVSSSLAPTSPSQIQHFTLHATNSIVIADTLNIIGTFYEDAQNLTVTTNINNPATPEGGINLLPSSIFWASSNPNLRNLTNNGVIQSQNLAVFGTTPPANYFSLINNGTISDKGSQIWANNFANSGVFSSGAQSFVLQSLTTTLTNGSITAGGNVSITTGSMLASNTVITAGQALTIAVTTNLTDNGPGNSNIWTESGGLYLPIKPLAGNLLGTTITNVAPDAEEVDITWAGSDLGYSIAGFTNNNVAVGKFILDPAVINNPSLTDFALSGTGVSNAIYVDYLELRDYATNRPFNNVQGLAFNPSLVIYYAQAVANGISVAEKINGDNTNHLRWLPAYVGYYSSTNIVYTNIFNGMTNITTNTVNSALAQSTTYDSDGDGIDNADDPTPFFVSGEMNFKLTLTNLPPLTALLSWQTIPDATNCLSYTTNLATGPWLKLTNFISPAPYGSGLTTVTVADPVSLTGAKFYKVQVVTSTAPPHYGPGP